MLANPDRYYKSGANDVILATPIRVRPLAIPPTSLDELACSIVSERSSIESDIGSDRTEALAFGSDHIEEDRTNSLRQLRGKDYLIGDVDRSNTIQFDNHNILNYSSVLFQQDLLRYMASDKLRQRSSLDSVWELRYGW